MVITTKQGLLPLCLVPGLGVSQATHFAASGLFCSMQASQSQVPAGAVNLANRLSPLVDPDPDAVNGAEKDKDRHVNTDRHPYRT